MIASEGPPNKKLKNHSDNNRKEKKLKSPPTREHKKSETEVTVEVFF